MSGAGPAPANVGVAASRRQAGAEAVRLPPVGPRRCAFLWRSRALRVKGPRAPRGPAGHRAATPRSLPGVFAKRRACSRRAVNGGLVSRMRARSGLDPFQKEGIANRWITCWLAPFYFNRSSPAMHICAMYHKRQTVSGKRRFQGALNRRAWQEHALYKRASTQNSRVSHCGL